MFALISLILISQAPAFDHFVDQRDGYSYRTVLLGDQQWFAENLRFVTPDSRCYAGDEANCAEEGRLYQLFDAMKACPPNWRVPTEDDWQKLERWLGMSEEELTQAKKLRGAGTGARLKPQGDTGFDLKYSGWIGPGGESMARGKNSTFWVATEAGDGYFWHRDIFSKDTGIWRSRVEPEHWLAVRCVWGSDVPR